ncbi:TPA: hypothetical protein U2Q27_001699 [Burkholderia cepacia]|nr:hypothetical protein [Burkholderia cepacia]HEM8509672.1 hypothetical protein [Burkholderia cepacia]
MSSSQPHPEPRKRKRASPPDPAYQFAVGRPDEGVIERTWQKLHSANEALLPPYPSHFEPVWNIRNVVRRMKAFVHTYRGSVEPFVLHLDARGNSSIVARSPARALAELFTSTFAQELRLIGTLHPDHRFHPLFQIFLDTDSEYGGNNQAAVATRIEIACNNYLSIFWRPTGLMGHALIDALKTLNELSKIVLEKIRSRSDEIKQFERGAQDTRTSAMQYAYHLIMRAPNPFFAHFTIHRSSHLAGNSPVSYVDIRKFLSKFKRSIKKDIPETNYLGYTILLRNNEKIGYWLDGFIYLSDNLGRAPAALEELTQKWNATVGAKRAEINCKAWPAHPDNVDAAVRALETITISTEPDFYCRTMPLDGHHAFWCSQSPVGKLAKRTRTRKRTARNAHRKEQASGNSFVRELQMDEFIAHAAEQWTLAAERKKKTLATRQTKAAKTLHRKNNRNDPES